MHPVMTLCPIDIFHGRNMHALRVLPGIEQEAVRGTNLFIDDVLTMWKILNVLSKNKDVRNNNPVEAEITSPDDARLDYLLEMADMCKKMGKVEKGKRRKSLTTDTSKAIYHTLNGIVELCKHQLATTHNFVLLGIYSTDPLEKEFGKLRQGSGGTYFLSVQQVIEKLDINKTKLLLKLPADLPNLDVDFGHECENCKYLLDDESSEVFDNLPELEDKILHETKMSLVHIAGYVTRRDDQTEKELLGLTTFYYQKYGHYTKSMDRGGLKVPSDTACQWTFFCYALFNCVIDRVCRKPLANLFMLVAEMY